MLRESDMRKVLGRIILQINSIKTNLFRERIIALHKHDEITSIDLTVFGNMIFSSNNSPWFTSKYIVNLGDTDEVRATITELLAKEWAIEERHRPKAQNFKFAGIVNIEQINTWQSIYSALDRSGGLARYIITLRLLNEAAANISMASFMSGQRTIKSMP